MFDKATYNDWEVQIKKFIKDQPIESYYHEITPGVKYNPFSLEINTVVTNGSLPIGDRFIGVEFNKNCTNKELIFALENGAQSIEFNISDDTDLDGLLKGVRLDYILPIVNFDGQKSTQNFENYLERNYNTSVISKILIHDQNHQKKDLNNITRIISSDNRNPINSLLEILESIRVKKPSKIAIKISLGNQFFLEIARLRSLRILVANLYRDLDLPFQELTVIANIDSSVIEGDFHNTLIHQTCTALSANIGGANVVQLQSWGKSSDSKKDRLSLNIQNILQLESHIDLHQDVMAGSYFIEDLTDKIAQSVWDKL